MGAAAGRPVSTPPSRQEPPPLPPLARRSERTPLGARRGAGSSPRPPLPQHRTRRRQRGAGQGGWGGGWGRARGARAAAARPPPTPRPGNPAPTPLHATLAPRGRVLIVGDVHGCAAELDALLAKAGYDERAGDALVLVGDVVNKGPASVAALASARAHGARVVRGNHDEAALAAWRQWRERRVAPGAGMEWVADAAAQAPLAWLATSPFSLAIPSRGVLVVHAGVCPPTGGAALNVAAQALDDLLEVRHVSRAPSGAAWTPLDKAAAKKVLKKGGKGVALWADAYSDEAAAAAVAAPPSSSSSLPAHPHIVFGHHASARLQDARRATGVDTGCVLGGELTALILPATPPAVSDLGSGYQGLGGVLVAVPAARAYAGRGADEV